MTTTTRAFLLALLAGAAPTLADDVVMPLDYAAAAGTHTFLGPLSSSERTYQLLIHADQLTGLVGGEITGLAFRSTSGATSAWPTAETTYAAFDIYLSPSVEPANRSFTFGENVAGTQVQVRSGPLVIPVGTYTSGGSPNEFGPTIEFTQGYTYTGGHLLVELRHPVSDGNSRSVDAIGAAIPGYGTQFSACWAGGYTATTGGLQGNFAVTRFTFTGGTGACYPNCDGSTTAPILNVADFTCFLQEFAAGNPYANCDESTTAPVLNVADFTCFLQDFAAGCP